MVAVARPYCTTRNAVTEEGQGARKNVRATCVQKQSQKVFWVKKTGFQGNGVLSEQHSRLFNETRSFDSIHNLYFTPNRSYRYKTVDNLTKPFFSVLVKLSDLQP